MIALDRARAFGRAPLALWACVLAACGDAEAPSPDASSAADAFVVATEDAPTSDAASSDARAIGLDASVERYAFAMFDRDVTDPARGREIGARVLYPLGTTGPHSVVLISHGGFGAANGETLFAHLGEELAAAGMVAVQIGHRRSTTNEQNRIDRPADVSFLIDALADGTLALPADFGGTLDTSRVGHTGHSAGAYTAHAVAGAAYPYGAFRDPRVAAIAPISPQGVGDEFEAFDRGPDDSTWTPVTLPVLVLLGGAELSTNGAGTFIEEDWRLRPFERYPDDADRFEVIVRGQEHIDMGAMGEPDVKAFLAQNIRAFFDVYLRGRGDPCAIGGLSPPAVGIESFERRPGASGSRIDRCL